MVETLSRTAAWGPAAGLARSVAVGLMVALSGFALAACSGGSRSRSDTLPSLTGPKTPTLSLGERQRAVSDLERSGSDVRRETRQLRDAEPR